MTTTADILAAPATSEASRLIAGEIRAEMGRQGVSQRELARRLGVAQPRVHTRIGVHATVELSVVDVLAMAKALNLSVEGFLVPLLPRLDSNQQPSGYAFPLVTASSLGAVGPVVPLWRYEGLGVAS